jgi:acyl transferase domain-containing protein
MSIDTACSSSLVALHQACRSLASGESAMALAGGVHMLLSPLPFVGFSKAHMLSADGRCNVFGADANGYVRAEGGAVLLLMPLSEARRRGLRIQAVIHSTGVNTDGRTIGIAYPNQEAQTALLHSMYAAPDLDPARLCYMEAHGTGTTAGDPVEARSIGLALADLRPGDEPLLVGSIKSNLGHLEPVSGMAGLLKAMLVLQKRMVPPNPGLSALNPDIDFTALHLRPVTELTPLGDRPGPLLAGVSSFGFGGANAHVILEEARPRPQRPCPRPVRVPCPPCCCRPAARPAGRTGPRLCRAPGPGRPGRLSGPGRPDRPVPGPAAPPSRGRRHRSGRGGRPADPVRRDRSPAG